MKRLKRHRIKREEAETSQTRNEEHDLAYYIHDRVELMHQVFSVLKQKELRTMAPECVRHISIDDLQELCTEELLGISSKRLCAILDGAEPPSDTESSSSSPDKMETISLDSISSDEEILSETSSKKKKHKHRHHKSKHRRSPAGEAEDTRASRAGLTVLELLELQARARAIRAALQRAAVPTEAEPTAVPTSGDDDEVVIKEEAPEVVEISSEDEKPSVQELEKNLQTNGDKSGENAKTVTKRINDLIITVPQSKPTKKIKLNRTKSVKKNDEVPKTNVVETVKTPIEDKKQPKEKKSKKKQKKKNKLKNEDGSDHDEIMLQLSDTEKMDLLEDFDRKSATSEDSDSSSDSSDMSSDSSDEDESKNKANDKNKTVTNAIKEDEKLKKNLDKKEVKVTNPSKEETRASKEESDKDVEMLTKENTDNEEANKRSDITVIEKSGSLNQGVSGSIDNVNESEKDTIKEPVKEIGNSEKDTTKETENSEKNTTKESVKETENSEKDTTKESVNETGNSEKMDVEVTPDDSTQVGLEPKEITKEVEEGEITEQNRSLSDGEISQESIDVKESTSNVQEVVCISDDEKKTKKKKKEKKKKSKKSDFRESADQNFYNKADPKEPTNTESKQNSLETDATDSKANILTTDKKLDYQSTDDVFEYLELSDDSSCYEVEGVSVLSKEPTAEEIAALSAKIDEIDRVEVVTEEEIREHEKLEGNKVDSEQIENNISWKDRYLKSKKVKNVLNTANILNALRKKNKELKKKIEESKKECPVVLESLEETETVSDVMEGSIDHYNTLQGSTTFVDPVKEVEESKVSKEMEKDAKQLLKMYKKLLKYNDINKKKDPNKKKKKKQKKNKNKDKDGERNKTLCN